MAVDPRALTGFAASAAAYDRARPSYPEAAVAHVVGEFGLGSGSVVLDLAAGTGKLTRRLVPRAGRVIAVEPSDDMRALLRTSLPQVEALAGTAEDVPLEDASVDAVCVGEAFHWFRAREAATEIARVLRPLGGLALLFNCAHWDDEENPWLRDFRALVDPHRLTAGGPWPTRPTESARLLDELGLFGPASSSGFEHVHRLTPKDFVTLVSSWSWIANLPADERGSVLERVRELIGARPEVTLRYVTETYSTRKL